MLCSVDVHPMQATWCKIVFETYSNTYLQLYFQGCPRSHITGHPHRSGFPMLRDRWNHMTMTYEPEGLDDWHLVFYSVEPRISAPRNVRVTRTSLLCPIPSPMQNPLRHTIVPFNFHCRLRPTDARPRLHKTASCACFRSLQKPRHAPFSDVTPTVFRQGFAHLHPVLMTCLIRLADVPLVLYAVGVVTTSNNVSNWI